MNLQRMKQLAGILTEGVIAVPALRDTLGETVPKFNDTSCSQCGQSFGPGDSGYSHCSDHEGKEPTYEDMPVIADEFVGEGSAEVSPDDIHRLADMLATGELTFDEFRGRLDSLEATDHSMRQGEMGNPDMMADIQAGRDHEEWHQMDDPSDEFEGDEFDEAITLGDESLGMPKYYIVNSHNSSVSAGPYESYSAALCSPDASRWIGSGRHTIEQGMEDDDGQFTPVDTDTPDTPMEEMFNNGYNTDRYARGDDFFPNGADGAVVNAVGPSGARHGDNPEQKKMQVDEVHKELVHGYRKYLGETSKLNELGKKTLKSYAKKSSADAEVAMWSGAKKAQSGDMTGAHKDFDRTAKRNKGEINALTKAGVIPRNE